MFIMPIEIEGIIIPNLPVKSHSYVYFIQDLTRILFTDGNFLPWMKSKYEKRLKRLLLLLYLYDTKHYTNNLYTLYQLSNIIKHNILHPDDVICTDEFALSPIFLSSFKHIKIFMI